MNYKANYIHYCPEHYQEIENYELAKADNFEGWVCHHRNGEEFSKEWLKANRMYYCRKDPHEFKFMRCQEHSDLHNGGTKLSEEMKQRISLTCSRIEHTKEWNNKISKSLMGHEFTGKRKHTEETKQKMSEARKAYWARKRGEHV